MESSLKIRQDSQLFKSFMHKMKFLTSSAAEDFYTQVEGMSELDWEDPQVSSSDQAA